MAIEITEFADVSITVSPVGVSGGNFGILGFLTKASDPVTNPITPAERGRAYTSLTSVAGDWPAGSEVYKAATAFYGQTPTPVDFVALMNYDTDTKAYLIGGTHATEAELEFVSNGSLSITIDGTDTALTGIDLTAVSPATHANVAAAIETEVQGVVGLATATVEYGQYGYEVTGIAAGAGTGTITFGVGDLADLLGLDQSVAILANGIDAETPVESLAAVDVAGIDVVGVVTHKDFRDVLSGATGETTAEIAAWAEASKKIFCNTTNSLATLNPASSLDIGAVLKAGSYRTTLTTFSRDSKLYPSASVFGRAASVNFETTGSTITLNLKSMPGVTAEDLTPAEFQALRDKYVSAVVKIGSSANAYTDSRMASGSWLDTTHGLMWLENRCETDLFNLLYQSATKVPATQAGINTTVNTLDGSLQAAVRNGLCAPGFLPDGTYLPEGYLITAVPLGDVPASDKSNRIYQGLSFVMVGAGALHGVVASGTFNE